MPAQRTGRLHGLHHENRDRHRYRLHAAGRSRFRRRRADRPDHRGLSERLIVAQTSCLPGPGTHPDAGLVQVSFGSSSIDWFVRFTFSPSCFCTASRKETDPDGPSGSWVVGASAGNLRARIPSICCRTPAIVIQAKIPRTYETGAFLYRIQNSRVKGRYLFRELSHRDVPANQLDHQGTALLLLPSRVHPVRLAGSALASFGLFATRVSASIGRSSK